MTYRKKVKNTKLKVESWGVLTLFTFIFSFSTAMAQEAFPAAGGNASGSGGTLSYTVGQLVYQTHTGTNGSVAEGVQQPYEISVLTGTKEFPGIKLNFQAYPNPTIDIIKLKVDGILPDDCYVSVFDINGRLLSNEKLIGNEKILNMRDLRAGNYLLQVVANQSVLKSFKIIKK